MALSSKAAAIPSYRRHKASGQAVVTLNGADHFLGPWNTHQSRAEYDRVLNEWLAHGRQLGEKTRNTDPDELLMKELIRGYRAHIVATAPQLEANVRTALKPVRAMYGEIPAAKFGPVAFQAVRQKLLDTIGPRGKPFCVTTLVEDLHMPMHVGDDHHRGGNDTQVRFFTRGSNMHRIWDTDIIERWSQDEGRWLHNLIEMGTDEAEKAAQAGTVEDWATESLLAAREAYQDTVTGRRIKPGTKLGDAYYEKSLPVAKRRLYQAAVRLAMVLNEALR